MKVNNKKAFTLAETLITLVIIGVISALTIPGVLQKTNKNEFITNLKKANSVLTGATDAVIKNQGPPQYWGISGSGLGKADVWKEYKQRFNIIEETGATSFITTDGMSFDFKFEIGNASDYGIADVQDGKTYGQVLVDVNGGRGPNKNGRDIFDFYITRDGIFPASKCDTTTGSGCAGRVIMTGKIDY